MVEIPFYNPQISYEKNYAEGPFGAFTDRWKIERNGEPQNDFLGHKVYLPFGIPAGPLVNSKFVEAAFNKGFDICVYKTVRTGKYPCHPWPNILAVHEERLEFDRKEPVIADSDYTDPLLSITNSFGVPSADPKIWQEDMENAVKAAGKGQVLIASFQGTPDGTGLIENYIQDCVKAAKLAKETRAPILELNTSCPNEGTANILCLDLDKTKKVATAIRKEIGSTPLILKLAYFNDDQYLETFVRELAPIVDGFSAINTITADVVDRDGKQALPGEGRKRSGICGPTIKWAGKDTTTRLWKLRNKYRMNYTIIAVGGIQSAGDFWEYIDLGADAALAATGSMRKAYLAKEIYFSEFNPAKRVRICG